jgi:hypothetical protein
MSAHELRFTEVALQTLESLASQKAKPGLYHQVCKTLAFLETDTRHPSLRTHHFSSLVGPGGAKVWEAYAQNRTPGAYRVFFCYGPDVEEGGKRIAIITILAITPHP